MLCEKDFLKLRNIHRKTPVSESLFNKVAGLQAVNAANYSCNLAPLKFNKNDTKLATVITYCLFRSFKTFLLQNGSKQL